MACTKIQMQSTKMAKIEVANTHFPVVLKHFFVFPEHCAFCLCEVLLICKSEINFFIIKIYLIFCGNIVYIYSLIHMCSILTKGSTCRKNKN